MFPLTNAQKAAIQNTDEVLTETLKDFKMLHKQLTEAIVELPHKNEDGVIIVHGSNMQCHRRADELHSMIKRMEWML